MFSVEEKEHSWNSIQHHSTMPLNESRMAFVCVHALACRDVSWRVHVCESVSVCLVLGTKTTNNLSNIIRTFPFSIQRERISVVLFTRYFSFRFVIFPQTQHTRCRCSVFSTSFCLHLLLFSVSLFGQVLFFRLFVYFFLDFGKILKNLKLNFEWKNQRPIYRISHRSSPSPMLPIVPMSRRLSF